MQEDAYSFHLAPNVIYEKVFLSPKDATDVAIHLMQSRQSQFSNKQLVVPKNGMYPDCNGVVFDFKEEQQYVHQYIACPDGRKNDSIIQNIVKPNIAYAREHLLLDSFYKRFEYFLPSGPIGDIYSKGIGYVIHSPADPYLQTKCGGKRHICIP